MAHAPRPLNDAGYRNASEMIISITIAGSQYGEANGEPIFC